jgi:hypothetical protein
MKQTIQWLRQLQHQWNNMSGLPATRGCIATDNATMSISALQKWISPL